LAAGSYGAFAARAVLMLRASRRPRAHL